MIRRARMVGWLAAVGGVMMLCAEATIAITKDKWGRAVLLTALAVALAALVLARLWRPDL